MKWVFAPFMPILKGLWTLFFKAAFFLSCFMFLFMFGFFALAACWASTCAVGFLACARRCPFFGDPFAPLDLAILALAICPLLAMLAIRSFFFLSPNSFFVFIAALCS